MVIDIEELVKKFVEVEATTFTTLKKYLCF